VDRRRIRRDRFVMSAELKLAVEAEVVEALDQAAASRIDQRIGLLVGAINDNIVKLRELVDKAKRGHGHLKTVHLFQVEHRNRSPAWTARRIARCDIRSPDSQVTSSQRWSRSRRTSTVKTSSMYARGQGRSAARAAISIAAANESKSSGSMCE